jgi:hypothetical protein
MRSRRMRWAEHTARMRELRNALSTCVGKPERKRPFGRPRHERKDNIKMDIKVIKWDGEDWIHLAGDRDGLRALVNMVMQAIS